MNVMTNPADPRSDSSRGATHILQWLGRYYNPLPRHFLSCPSQALDTTGNVRTYNVTSRRVRVTTIAMEKQEVLNTECGFAFLP